MTDLDVEPSVQVTTNENTLSNEELRSQLYLNVPEIIHEFSPQEYPARAYQVNPNTTERIKVVLDNILENSKLKNNFLCVNSVKVRDGKIEKF